MTNIVKSAKGVPVDFDLLKIKQQMANAPKTTVVQAREDFIDKKFSRRVNKLQKQIASQIDVKPSGKIKTDVDISATVQPEINAQPDIIDDFDDSDVGIEQLIDPPTNTTTTRNTRKKEL